MKALFLAILAHLAVTPLALGLGEFNTQLDGNKTTPDISSLEARKATIESTLENSNDSNANSARPRQSLSHTDRVALERELAELTRTIAELSARLASQQRQSENIRKSVNAAGSLRER